MKAKEKLKDLNVYKNNNAPIENSSLFYILSY